MRERGDGRTVTVLFTRPCRPYRRCGWRVLRRRPVAWFAFHLNKLLGHPHCHCAFSDGESVRSVTFGRLAHYPYMSYIEHPMLSASVSFRVESPPDMERRARWSCVSDVRDMLLACGIKTDAALTPSALHKLLESHPNVVQSVLVTA